MPFKPAEEVIEIPAGHTLKVVESGERGSYGETDFTVYDLIDSAGNAVARYEVCDTTQYYPPQRQYQTVNKLS